MHELLDRRHPSTPSSPPSSPFPVTSEEGSVMDSSFIATPEAVPTYSSVTSKGSHNNRVGSPMVSPDCGIEFNVTLSSPNNFSPSTSSHTNFTNPFSGHVMDLPYLTRKRSTPILERHRSIGSFSPGWGRNSANTAAYSEIRRRHSAHHLDPFSAAASEQIRPKRRRDADGLIQKPPPIMLRRSEGSDDVSSSRSQSISPARATPITIPSIPEFMRVPSLPGTPGPSTLVHHQSPPASVPKSPVVQSKGHIQPHVTNLPRRKRREPKYTAAELREQRRWDWERRTALCEVGTGSGVFVSYLDDQDDDEFPEEFLAVLRIVEGEEPQLAEVNDRTLHLTVPAGPAARDDGLPHLTPGQLQAAGRFVRNVWTAHHCHDHPRRLLIMTSNERPADAMAIAVMLIASVHSETDDQPPPPPPSSSHDVTHHDHAHQRHHSTKHPLVRLRIDPPHPPSRPMSPVHTPDPDAMNVDSSPTPPGQELAIPDNIHHADDLHTPVHDIIMRLHDLATEDDGHYVSSGGLKGPWRGVISRDGMDFLAGCLAQSTLSS